MKKCWLFFVVLCLLLPVSAGAQSLVDSLKQVLATNKYDTAIVNTYNELLWEYTGVDNDSALYYAKKSIELGEKINYKQGLANAHRYVGNVYELIANYPKALYHQQMGLQLAEELNNKSAIASSLSNIGTVYERLSDYKKALDYQERSLKLCKELDQKEAIAMVYGNIGNIYSSIGATTKALECYETCLAMNDTLGNLYGVAISLGNIGNIYIEREEYELALDNLLRSLDLRKKIGHRQGMASCMASIGKCYHQMGNITQAKKYFEESIEIAREIDAITTERDANLGLYEVNKKLGNYKKALEYHEEYTRLNDSVFSTKRSEEINNIKTQYALDQQQQEMEEKAKEREAKDNEERVKLKAQADADHQRQQLIIYASVFVLIIVLVFSVFLYNRFLVTRRQNVIIEEQKSIVEERNKQVTDSINYARRIQSAILPSEEDLKKLFPESFVLFKPKDIVSGDFYWMSNLANGDTLIATADCTGHGVPGGFMSMLGSSLLNEIVNEKGIHAPAEVLNILRDKIITALKQHGQTGENKDGMDIVLYSINTQQNALTYSAANNNFYLVRDGKMQEFEAEKMPIGYYIEEMKPFTQKTISIGKNDIIFSFTDGYADQFGGPAGKKFKYNRFEELILNCSTKPLAQQKKLFHDAFEDWRGSLEQIDDVCVLGIKI